MLKFDELKEHTINYILRNRFLNSFKLILEILKLDDIKYLHSYISEYSCCSCVEHKTILDTVISISKDIIDFDHLGTILNIVPTSEKNIHIICII